MKAAKATLLDGSPQYCSACFNQDNTKQHIDLDASCDRGYALHTDIPITMDDLVLCEDCIRNAAQLIGMEDKSTTERELSELRIKADRLERESRQAQRYADTLEDAFDKRPEPVRVDHRKKPRQIKEPA